MMTPRLARLLAASTLSLGLATGFAAPLAAQDGAPALDLSALTPEQSEAFGAQVRAYLLANPEVIMEAVSVLEQRQQNAAADADRALVSAFADEIFDDGYSWVGGNPEGDITVVEFMDYRCGYCRRAKDAVDQLLEQDGNIRFVVKEFPILGEPSVLASRFAVATQIVAGDEAYGAVHDALMALDAEPSEGVLRRLARTLGLEADAIFDEMNSDEVTRRLNDTRQLAQHLQITGTPGFIIGGQMLRGAAPVQAMMAVVAEERDAS